MRTIRRKNMYHFLRFPNFKRKAVTLSYDDASYNDEQLVDVMRKYGLKGTLNVDSSFLDQEGRLSVDTLKKWQEEGIIEIAVHGVKHHSLTEMDDVLAVREISEDRVSLEKSFGKIIKGMAYANGKYDDRVVNILERCGIDYARTTISTHWFDIPGDWLRMPTTCHHNDADLMKLAKAFVENKEEGYYWGIRPMLFYLWGHSFEFHNNQNWHVLEEFGAYVGGREDIWYATNGEIFEYVQAYNRLIWSAEATMIKNPSAIDVYIDYMGKKIVIKAGEIVHL